MKLYKKKKKNNFAVIIINKKFSLFRKLKKYNKIKIFKLS